MGSNQWNIGALQKHSERMARYMRWTAMGLAVPAFVCLLFVAVLPLFESFRRLEVT